MKTAGKHMAVGSEVVRGGWAGASGGWAVVSGLGWMLGGGNRAVSGGSQAVSIGSRAATAIVALAAGVMVTGCGGGGDDGPAAIGSAAVSTEKPVEQPILTMPTSTYTGMHAEAFKRINEARIAAGVSALRQSVELDRAAQAHSDYQVRNNVFGHYEDPAHPLFTGVDHVDRASAQEYSHQIKVEVISLASPALSGSQHIDLHLNSVYHLHGVLTPTANEVGMGFSTSNTSGRTFGSISTGVTDNRMLTVRNPWMWPAADGVNVPTTFLPASEVPNPLPDVAPNLAISVGSPIMYCQRSDSGNRLEISSTSFIEETSKKPEPVWVLKHASALVSNAVSAEIRSDPNATQSTAHCVFLIPKSPLKPQTRYEVSINAVRNGIPTDTRWSFVTGN